MSEEPKSPEPAIEEAEGDSEFVPLPMRKPRFRNPSTKTPESQNRDEHAESPSHRAT